MKVIRQQVLSPTPPNVVVIEMSLEEARVLKVLTNKYNFKPYKTDLKNEGMKKACIMQTELWNKLDNFGIEVL